MIRSCQGLTALVTGASSGIGKAIAYELAGQGADLVLAARNFQKLKEVSEDLRNRFKARVWVFESDLSRKENCERLFRFTETNGITVDILVNNAGIGHYGPFVKHSAGVLDHMLGLNIEALVTLTSLFLPGMQQRRKGGVLNVASTAAFQPIPHISVYAATKAFVLNFSEALWKECLKYDVRVFCVCPGHTATEFHQTAGIEKRKAIFRASAEEVAGFAVRKFLKGTRPTGIFGLRNKLMTYAERLAPRVLVVFVTDFLYRPSKKDQRAQGQD